MNAIAEAEAGQLHRHDVGHGRNEHTFFRGYRRGKQRYRLHVFRADALADEYQMDRTPGLRLLQIDKHVDAGGMPVFEAVRPRRFSNAGEIPAIDRDVDVAR